MPLDLNITPQIVEGTNNAIVIGLKRLNDAFKRFDNLDDPSLIEIIRNELEGAYICAKPRPNDLIFAREKDLQTMYNIANYFMTTVADLAYQQGIKVGDSILGKILETPTKILEDVDDKYWYAKPTEKFTFKIE